MGFFKNLSNAVRAASIGWGLTRTKSTTSVANFFGNAISGGGGVAKDIFPDSTTNELLATPKKVATVYSCIQAKAQAFQSAKLTVGQITEDENGNEVFEPNYEHPALRGFTENPWLSENEIEIYISMHLDIVGACYLWKWRDGFGLPSEIWPIPPQWVTVEAVKRPLDLNDKRRVIAGYKVSPPGMDAFVIQPEDMIYIRDIDPASLWKPLSAGMASNRAVITEEKADINQADQFENLKAPGIVVKSKHPLTQKQEKDLHRVLEEKMGISARKNAMVISGEGSEIQTLNPLADVNWKDVRLYDEIRICQAYRVPPLVAHAWVGLENSPWSNSEEAWRSFYQHTMVGRWMQVASALSRDNELIPEGSKDEFRFDTSKIRYMQEEQDNLIDQAIKKFHGGLITRNRALEIMGEAPLPENDPLGNEFVMPSNLVPFNDEEM